MNSLNQQGVWVSVLTLAPEVVTSPLGANPDQVLDRLEWVGWQGVQWIPLRWFCDTSSQKSGIESVMKTFEWPWEKDYNIFTNPLAQLAFGNSCHAHALTQKIAKRSEEAISIDFDESSATEIAWLPDREILPWRRMVIDTFHARDLMIGRDAAMKWSLPTKWQVDLTYQGIFAKKPNIVAIQIQERNTDSLYQLLAWDPESVFLHEIATLKKYLSQDWQNIPVILELHPFPRGVLTEVMCGQKNTQNFIKSVVNEVNEIWYS